MDKNRVSMTLRLGWRGLLLHGYVFFWWNCKRSSAWRRNMFWHLTFSSGSRFLVGVGLFPELPKYSATRFTSLKCSSLFIRRSDFFSDFNACTLSSLIIAFQCVKPCPWIKWAVTLEIVRGQGRERCLYNKIDEFLPLKLTGFGSIKCWAYQCLPLQLCRTEECIDWILSKPIGLLVPDFFPLLS